MKNEVEINKAIDFVTSEKEGTVLSHSKFREIMGFKHPEKSDFASNDEYFEAYDNERFRYLSFMENVREALLKHYKICLNSVPGMGYVVLTPKQQIDFGIKRSKKGVYKQLKRGKNILTHVDKQRLGLDDLRKASDGMAALSRLKQFTRRAGL
jgi:hypothetical protein